MSLVYLDSCGDGYGTGQLSLRWDDVTGAPVVVPGAGRRFGHAINLPGGGDQLGKTVPALAEYGAGVAVKVDTLALTNVLMFYEGTTGHVMIRITATGALEVLRAPSSSLEVTEAGLILPGAYNYLEAKVEVHDSAGTVEVWLNSVKVIDLDTVDTRNGGTGVINNIRLTGSTGNVFIDDVYLINTAGSAPQNTLLGDTRIDAVRPVADGTMTDWPIVVPDDPPSQWDKINEAIPDGDLSFIASAELGSQSLFVFEPLIEPDGPSPIFGVQLGCFARKNRATVRTLRGRARSGGEMYNGAAVPLGEDYRYAFSRWDQDPDTDADWTEQGLTEAEFGVRVE